jgi:hypothetical protein
MPLSESVTAWEREKNRARVEGYWKNCGSMETWYWIVLKVLKYCLYLPVWCYYLLSFLNMCKVFQFYGPPLCISR